MLLNYKPLQTLVACLCTMINYKWMTLRMLPLEAVRMVHHLMILCTEPLALRMVHPSWNSTHCPPWTPLRPITHPSHLSHPEPTCLAPVTLLPASRSPAHPNLLCLM